MYLACCRPPLKRLVGAFWKPLAKGLPLWRVLFYYKLMSACPFVAPWQPRAAGLRAAVAVTYVMAHWVCNTGRTRGCAAPQNTLHSHSEQVPRGIIWAIIQSKLGGHNLRAIYKQSGDVWGALTQSWGRGGNITPSEAQYLEKMCSP